MIEFQILPAGTVTSPAGFTAVAHAANIKKENQLDLALVVSETDCSCAAMFTKNQVVAAPVIVDRETLAQNSSRLRAVVINSKNANACTGEPGLANARATQQIAAGVLGCQADQILVLSTGVIGVQLPMGKLEAGIVQAAKGLSRENGRIAAEAIMTTDTRPKHLSITVNLPGGPVTIGGMAKGAGMIHPNMATMLAVLTTDAKIAPDVLDGLLRTAVNQSFNRISIDGDTSTNDTILLLANGVSETAVADPDSVQTFSAALNQLCTALAQMIVRDGEGATKFVEIQVTCAQSDDDAHQIANTIAISPLVKTAFAGSDANWGRLLMAAGRAGVTFDQSKINLWIGVQQPGELQLVANGTPTLYQEAAAAAVFAEPEFKILLDLGSGGGGTAVVWTTDLSHEYVSINADYRT
ncbi:MAG: bifunctional glutamate N-acetyltransferase/amino-acid acetyltransferase ArgJ [Ardenticatenaceae bacterium]|nr:bifunctional glutamate N-acetyltransferase/amino-acid acetyltransferase ArgJ [Anaerolineales bacterium]MCB8941403.1 bifunctional glutamate N-acetyltransferase/amino-acid acetyltransferase ArgJ [Ardenticatenaceae bacterium]MCB8972759.1 bifunctional glutamate N-acetyltransferase/amino-acid acetyltransferase ArgJ [Ardenticatenaceae bacterium]